MKLIQKTSLLLLVLLLSVESFAQLKDTISVMTYNLMYYRETTSFCTSSNNNTTTKENAMEDIIDYALPDILIATEMGGSSPVNPFRLLTNSLNQGGRNYYSFANSSGSGSLVNMLYFNTNKFTLTSQTTITKDLNNANLVRAIDVYHLRYLDSNLSIHQDTIELHVVAAHLKAGSSSADETERALATEAVMAHLDSMNANGNYIMAGDFNLYSSTEPAYQDLVSYSDPTLRFFDPINVAGNWHNNSIYSFLHTQSTRTSGGCFAGGGMDDRFDFILASDEIMNNTDRMRYIPNTYKALGQDGNRFNQTIISPTNSSVPTVVSQALYNMSDHLPVVMDLELSIPNTTSIQEHLTLEKLRFQNPTIGNLLIDFSNQTEKIQRVELMDMSGKVLIERMLNSDNYIDLDISYLPQGAYVLKVVANSSAQRVEKVIKL